MLDKIHSEVQAQVNKKIEDASSLTIQCDSYSTTTNEGIINFIVNTPEPVFYKHVETKDVSQTGEYLAEVVFCDRGGGSKKIYGCYNRQHFLL